jgi:RNA polymerase sigma-70 factor (ECF subfamily)
LPTQNQYKEQEAFLSFQRGEEKGFAWLFRRLYPSLSFYAAKIANDKAVAEEIAAGAFVKIWKRQEQFETPEKTRAYLYRIVRNDALKHLNKEKKQLAADTEVVYLYGGEQEKDHFNSLVKAETTRQLAETIKVLPAKCSKVFRLLYIEGKSIKETAETLGLSTSTVKTHKKRGLEALRKKMAFLWALVC